MTNNPNPSAQTEPLSSEGVSAREEIARDTWADFESEHLTDGNDGWRTADICRACRAAFDAALPNGIDAALKAALAALSRPSPSEGQEAVLVERIEILEGMLIDCLPHENMTIGRYHEIQDEIARLEALKQAGGDQ